MMNFSRRGLFAGLAGAGLLPISTAAAETGDRDDVASRFGIVADAARDQTPALQKAIDHAARNGQAIALGPGTYLASGLTGAGRLHISGTPGLTQIVNFGSGPLLRAEGGDVQLSGLTFDGNHGNRSSGDNAGLVEVRDASVSFEHCKFRNSATNGLSLTGCHGRIVGCDFAKAQKTGVFSLDGKGLEISGNTLADMGDNGIQIWQSSPRADGSIISYNRIARSPPTVAAMAPMAMASTSTARAM